MTDADGLALAEGFYCYAEKLLWGYEEVERDPAEALRFFRQAADLGFTDAHIRIGECYLHGRAVDHDASTALANFAAATEAGNFVGLAFMAILASRSRRTQRSDVLWNRFFEALAAAPTWPSSAASVGEILHRYVEEELRVGAEPHHVDALRHYKTEIIVFHQDLLEHARSEEVLTRLGAVSSWLSHRL